MRASADPNAKVDLSFIVLNYNNPPLTQKCCGFIASSLEKLQFSYEIIVVDNSTDEYQGRLAGLLEDSVITICNEKNIGFAAGCNQGIRKSRGDYIVLLNNDAFINGDSIMAGFDSLEMTETIGIWAPRLLNADGSIQKSIGLEPGLRELLGEYLGLFRKDSYGDFRSWTKAQNVETVTGAFMMIPRHALDVVGLLDEDFFFTSEDTDFCSRIRKKSYVIRYDPTVSIIHASRASQTWKWLNDPYLHKYRALFIRKQKGFLQWMIARLIIRSGLAKRRLRALLKSRLELISGKTIL
jgi:N-acetylglucosaminyl-diphospho-decaprenol L-rhamnosyltransferase